jgi:tetratricopeptide (TPR) repeat protein
MKKSLVNIVLAGVGSVVEIVSMVALIQGLPASSIIGMHLLAAVLLTSPILALAGFRWSETRLASWWLILSINASLPVMGPLVSLILMAMDHRLRTSPSESMFAVGDPLEQADQTNIDLTPISQSLTAILNSRAVRARRNAILALRAFQDPAAVRVLRRAIRDSDEQVRSYADGRLKRLIDGMEAAIKELEQRLVLDPNNHFFQLALAEQLYEMVEMGLVNPENETHMLRRVADLLHTCRRGQHFPEAEILALRCNLRLGFAENARACLERLKEMNYRTETLAQYHFEVLFEERDWETFFGELKSAMELLPPPQIKQLADFWLTSSGAKT